MCCVCDTYISILCNDFSDFALILCLNVKYCMPGQLMRYLYTSLRHITFDFLGTDQYPRSLCDINMQSSRVPRRLVPPPTPVCRCVALHPPVLVPGPRSTIHAPGRPLIHVPLLCRTSTLFHAHAHTSDLYSYSYLYSDSCSYPFSYSYSHTHPHSHSYSYTQSLSPFHSHSYTQSHSPLHSHSHSYTQSQSHSYSLPPRHGIAFVHGDSFLYCYYAPAANDYNDSFR